MLFTSISFIYYFLPILLIFYFILPKKNIVLLIFSLIFYFYGEPKYLFLMIFEILIAYIGAIVIEKYKSKDTLLIFILIHLLLLLIFKYTNFIIENINLVFNSNISYLSLVLPIGISFYTFQSISYIADVYRNKIKAQRNIFTFATYISLFPQLIAGPIVRYEQVENELSNRSHNFLNFAYGIRRFSIGLAKKALIANALGELCNNLGLSNEKTIVLYWISAISYMLQIYFDFSGYSDMAIGLGRMFGFHFMENFNYPYISKSITEFWKRWHISLSTWFKDYVYIPLGGNKVGKKKLIRNILIVWTLTGIWHGASWNYIIWGLMFGIILVFEKLWFKKYLDKLPNFMKHIYVLFIVMISFIFFGTNNINEALKNITGLVGLNGEKFINDFTLYYLRNYFIILIIAVIGSTNIFVNLIENLKKNNIFNKIINFLEPIYIFLILIVVTAYLIDNSYNPFLYFRF